MDTLLYILAVLGVISGAAVTVLLLAYAFLVVVVAVLTAKGYK